MLTAKQVLQFLDEEETPVVCDQCGRDDCKCPPGECDCEPLNKEEQPAPAAEPAKVESFYQDDYKRNPDKYKLVMDSKVKVGDAEILVLGGYVEYKPGDISWAVTSQTISKESKTGAIVASGSVKTEEEAIKAIKKYEDIKVSKY
jgi:hypothetical protein